MKLQITPQSRVLTPAVLLGTIISATIVLTASADLTNCTPPPAGLVSWWRAETNALDEVGGHNGTPYNGVGFAPGEAGQAFVFNGTNSYVEVPDSPALRLTNELTIEFWVKRQQVVLPEYLLNKGGDWTRGALNYGVAFAAPQYNNMLQFLFAGGNRGAGSVSDLNWHHCVIVARNGDADPTFYLDGVPQPITYRAGASTINLYPSTEALHIGAQLDPAWNYFGKAIMDELSLYSRALAAAEVQAIYNAGSAGKCKLAPPCATPPAGLVSWWKGEGNALDQVGTNNGTLAGNTTYGPGVVAQGFVFDGRGDAVTVGNPASLQMQDLTIEAWVKRASSSITSHGSGGNGIIFGYGYGGYGLYLDPAGLPALTRVGIDQVKPSIAITGTSFHHLAVSKTGSTVVFYVDGVAYAASAYNPGFVFSTGAAIGARGDNSDNSFLGTIDEVAVYNRALSASEIQAIYLAGAAGKCTPTPTPTCASPPAGLVSWWAAEGNALDSVGSNAGALHNGVGFTSGKVGQAFVFNGTNSYVEVADSPALRLTNTLTIECWVKRQQADWPYDYLLNKGGDWSRGALNYGVAYASGGYGYSLRFVFAGGDRGTVGVTDLNWHHIAIVARNGDADPTFYLDGVPQVVTSRFGASTIKLYPSTEPLHIGAQVDPASGWSYYSKAIVDELSLYNRGLTAAEIQAIYAAGSLGKCTTPTLPFILTQPASQTVTNGVNTSFTVVAGGATPLSYQWQFNGTNLGGATSSVLMLTNVQVAQAGNYAARVTNSYGSTISSNAVLTVNGALPCVTPPAGLVSWWKGEGNALDQVGTNNGTLGGNAACGPGLVGQGFVFDGSGDAVILGNPTNLQIQDFTIEAWVKRASSSITSYGSGGNGIIFGYGYGGYGLYLGPTGQPVLTKVGINDVRPSITVTDTNFHHLAVSKSGSTVVFYIDGVAYAVAAYNPGFSFSTGAAIGARGDNSGNSFLGTIDELSIYSRTLAASEIQAIYNAGSAGKCTPTPPACTPPPSGLVSWWAAEGNALDSIGTNAGVLHNGAGFTTGKVGQAFSFNGTNSYVQVPSSAGLNPTGSFSIETWVYLRRDPSATVALVNKWGDTAELANQRSYTLNFLPGRALHFAITDLAHQWDSSFHAFATDSGAVTLQTWNHVVAVYDQSSGTRRIFVNGAQVKSRTDTPITIYNGVAPLTFGAASLGGGKIVNYFDGLLDEVSLFNRALSADEVQALYNAGGAGKCPPVSPSILTQPQSQTTGVGSNVTFTVTAAGTPPLSYQWRLGGTNLAGATGTSLTLSNVQPAQAGNYAAQVTNAYGSTISSNAVLTVTQAVPCVTPPAGLVSWWRGESNAFDQLGVNNGAPSGNVTYGTGRVGRAFAFGGANGDGVNLGNPASLRLQDLTIETWIKRASTSQVTSGPLDGGDFLAYGSGGYGFAMYANGSLTFGKSYVSEIRSIPGLVTDTNWHHVAVTKSGSTVVYYVDGVAYPVAAYTAVFTFTTTAAIGMLGNSLYGFWGSIDELAVYNRALAAAEIQAIYNVGSWGKCATSSLPFIVTQPANQTVTNGAGASFMVAAGGTPPLSYQWQFNGTNLGGATGSVLMLTNVQMAQAGNYAARVTNSYGSTISSNAVLTVNQAPPCVTPPAGLVSWWAAEGNALDSGGSNAGVLHNGVGFASGKVGQAFVFNGTNSYVEVADSPALRLTNALTIEFWVKRQDLGMNDYIVNKGGDWTRGGLNYGVSIARSQYGSHHGFQFAGGSRDSISIADLNWHHIAVVARNGDVDPTFYVDGVPQPVTARAGASTINLYPSTEPLRIGAQLDPAWNYYSKAIIDEMSIYSRALAASEIQAIYNAGSAGKCAPTPPACTPPPAGLVSWWAAENNASDAVGGNNGTLQGGASFAPGQVGQAFNVSRSGGTVVVPDSPSLRLTNGLTTEAWINARSFDSVVGCAIISKVSINSGNNGYQFILVGSTIQGLLNSPGTSWPSQRIISAPIISTGVWYHVAFTYDQSAMKLYCNGQLVMTNVIGAHPIATSPSELRISGADNHGFFDGLIDEPSVYSRALAAAEIQAIYNAGSVGKCGLPPSILTQPRSQTVAAGACVNLSVEAAGTSPLSYQWRHFSTNLPSATNVILTLSNIKLNDAGDYRVVITNSAGSITSAVAVLSLAASPVINSLSFNSSTYRLTVPTEVGPTYVVEYKDDLEDPSWRVLTTIVGTGFPIPITDNGLTNTARFYRVRVR